MDTRTRAFARSFAFVYQPIPKHLFNTTAWDHQIARDAWERLTRLARFYPYNEEAAHVLAPQWIETPPTHGGK